MEENIYKDLEYWLCMCMMIFSWYGLAMFWLIGFLINHLMAIITFYVSIVIFVLCIVRMKVIEKKYRNKTNQ